MTYETFPHEADIGIRGIGKTIEEAFCEGAKAMFSVEVDIEKVEPIKKIEIKCQAQNIEELFIEWLNALLAQASINEMVFSDFGVTIVSIKKKNMKNIEEIEKKNKDNDNKSKSKGDKKDSIKNNEIFKLEGYALGEKLQIKKHNIKDEIKGATYSQLKVEKKGDKWIAQCIVDV